MRVGVGMFDEEGVGGRRNVVELGGGRGRMSASDTRSNLVLRGYSCAAYRCSRSFERPKCMREAVFWQVKMNGCPG
jgi:hypothetical protein